MTTTVIVICMLFAFLIGLGIGLLQILPSQHRQIKKQVLAELTLQELEEHRNKLIRAIRDMPPGDRRTNQIGRTNL